MLLGVSDSSQRNKTRDDKLNIKSGKSYKKQETSMYKGQWFGSVLEKALRFEKQRKDMWRDMNETMLCTMIHVNSKETNKQRMNSETSTVFGVAMQINASLSLCSVV